MLRVHKENGKLAIDYEIFYYVQSQQEERQMNETVSI
jgi:hypothetical protein